MASFPRHFGPNFDLDGVVFQGYSPLKIDDKDNLLLSITQL